MTKQRDAARAQRMAWCVAASLAVAAPVAGSAATLQIAPVRLVLDARRPVAAMTIGNGEDSEVAIQADVFAWSQRDGDDVYEPTRDVLVNPSLFRVQPGAQQIVRVGLQVPAADDERSYRIFLRQLPRDQALPREAGAAVLVQTLLRVGVPIFVPPAAPRIATAWRLQAQGASTAASGADVRYRLVLDNQGSEHLQLTHVAVRRAGGGEVARKSLSQYVLAGESGAITLDLPPLEAEADLQVETQSDARTPLPVGRVRVPRAEAASR